MGSSSSRVVSERAPLAVRGGEEDSRQFDATTLTTGQGAERLPENAVFETEAAGDTCSFALGFVSAEGREPILELTVLLDRAVLRFLIEHLAHQNLLLLHLAQHRVEATCGENPVLGEDAQVAFFGVLREVSEFTGAYDASRICLTFTGQDAQCGRLSGSVTSDESDPVARLDAQRRPGSREKGADTGTNFEVSGGNQANSSGKTTNTGKQCLTTDTRTIDFTVT